MAGRARAAKERRVSLAPRPTKVPGRAGAPPAGRSRSPSPVDEVGSSQGGGPDRGWDREVDRFARWKAAETSIGADWMRRLTWELRRHPRLLGRVLGEPLPVSVRQIEDRHLLALRAGLRWEKPTFAIHFAALRQFLRWGGNPIADRPRLWKLPAGPSSRRRWLSREQLRRLYRAARGRERLLIALEGLNGLRRVEVLRLRAGDVLREESSLRVLGKGRDGGKWRKIPAHPIVLSLLLRAVAGKEAAERLVPLARSAADRLLRRAADRAGFASEGLRVSHHDLRRTFGRLAYRSGMELVQLQHLYGHSSVEMTAHYIGADAEAMRQGLDRLVLTEARGLAPGPPRDPLPRRRLQPRPSA